MKYLGKIENDKDLVTKEYVDDSISSKTSDATPQMDGTGAAGTSTSFSRADHVHPTDTTIRGNTTPLMDGTAAVGNSNKYARENHVHPTDTSRASKGIIADDFSSSHPYEVGEYCIYNNLLYECTTEHTGAWNSSHFEQVDIGDEIKNLDDIKANNDGYYEQMSVGNAEQLISNIGITDKVPYNFRVSGGSADVGDRENDMIVGGTIAWNQHVRIVDANYGSASAYTGEVTITSDGTNKSFGFGFFKGTPATRVKFSDGHKLFCSINVTDISVTDFEYAYFTSAKVAKVFYATGLCQHVMETNGGNVGFNASTTNAMSVNTDTITAKDFYVIDLTQAFGPDIADYIYSLSAANAVEWVRNLFPKNAYAYNLGSLESVNASAHNTIGLNAYDNSTGKAKLLGGHQYQISGAYSALAYTDINGAAEAITPDADGLFTPTNDGELTVTDGDADTTCVSLYWDGEMDGVYEPYKKNVYALDSSLTLRGIPKLDADNKLYYDGDIYSSNGSVERKYGIIELNTSGWVLATGQEHLFYSAFLNGIADAYGGSGSATAKLICSKYTRQSLVNTYQNLVDKTISFSSTGRVYICDTDYSDPSDLRTSLAGVYLVYPLVTSTTEQAATYINPQIVNNFGTEEYVDAGVVASTRDVSIPVGHTTVYQANLRAKLETAPNSPNGNGDYIMRQTNGNNEFVPLVIPNELPTMPTTDGTYTLRVVVTSGTPTLSWVSA